MWKCPFSHWQQSFCVFKNKRRKGRVVGVVGSSVNALCSWVCRHFMLHSVVFWSNGETLQWASPWAIFFFQQQVLTPCLCVTFWWLLQYFQLGHCYYIYYGDRWSVVFDVIFCFGVHRSHLRKTNLTEKCHLYSDCSTGQPVCHFSPSPWASLFWDPMILKLSQLITLQWSLSVHTTGRVMVSHFKSKAGDDRALWGSHVQSRDSYTM